MAAAEPKRPKVKKAPPLEITAPKAVVSPRPMLDAEPEVLPGLRRCPSPTGYTLPLIIQAIRPEVCMQRQRDFYHKCHRCQFRGKSAEFELGS